MEHYKKRLIRNQTRDRQTQKQSRHPRQEEDEEDENKIANFSYTLEKITTSDSQKGSEKKAMRQKKVARKRAVCRAKFRHTNMELFKLGTSMPTSLCKTKQPYNVCTEKTLQLTCENQSRDNKKPEEPLPKEAITEFIISSIEGNKKTLVQRSKSTENSNKPIGRHSLPQLVPEMPLAKKVRFSLDITKADESKRNTRQGIIKRRKTVIGTESYLQPSVYDTNSDCDSEPNPNIDKIKTCHSDDSLLEKHPSRNVAEPLHTKPTDAIGSYQTPHPGTTTKILHSSIIAQQIPNHSTKDRFHTDHHKTLVAPQKTAGNETYGDGMRLVHPQNGISNKTINHKDPHVDLGSRTNTTFEEESRMVDSRNGRFHIVAPTHLEPHIDGTQEKREWFQRTPFEGSVNPGIHNHDKASKMSHLESKMSHETGTHTNETYDEVQTLYRLQTGRSQQINAPEDSPVHLGFHKEKLRLYLSGRQVEQPLLDRQQNEPINNTRVENEPINLSVKQTSSYPAISRMDTNPTHTQISPTMFPEIKEQMTRLGNNFVNRPVKTRTYERKIDTLIKNIVDTSKAAMTLPFSIPNLLIMSKNYKDLQMNLTKSYVSKKMKLTVTATMNELISYVCYKLFGNPNNLDFRLYTEKLLDASLEHHKTELENFIKSFMYHDDTDEDKCIKFLYWIRSISGNGKFPETALRNHQERVYYKIPMEVTPSNYKQLYQDGNVNYGPVLTDNYAPQTRMQYPLLPIPNKMPLSNPHSHLMHQLNQQFSTSEPNPYNTLPYPTPHFPTSNPPNIIPFSNPKFTTSTNASNLQLSTSSLIAVPLSNQQFSISTVNTMSVSNSGCLTSPASKTPHQNIQYLTPRTHIAMPPSDAESSTTIANTMPYLNPQLQITSPQFLPTRNTTVSNHQKITPQGQTSRHDSNPQFQISNPQFPTTTHNTTVSNHRQITTQGQTSKHDSNPQFQKTIALFPTTTHHKTVSNLQQITTQGQTSIHDSNPPFQITSPQFPTTTHITTVSNLKHITIQGQTSMEASNTQTQIASPQFPVTTDNTRVSNLQHTTTKGQSSIHDSNLQFPPPRFHEVNASSIEDKQFLSKEQKLPKNDNPKSKDMEKSIITNDDGPVKKEIKLDTSKPIPVEEAVEIAENRITKSELVKDISMDITKKDQTLKEITTDDVKKEAISEKIEYFPESEVELKRKIKKLKRDPEDLDSSPDFQLFRKILIEEDRDVYKKVLKKLVRVKEDTARTAVILIDDDEDMSTQKVETDLKPSSIDRTVKKMQPILIDLTETKSKKYSSENSNEPSRKKIKNTQLRIYREILIIDDDRIITVNRDENQNCIDKIEDKKDIFCPIIEDISSDDECPSSPQQPNERSRSKSETIENTNIPHMTMKTEHMTIEPAEPYIKNVAKKTRNDTSNAGNTTNTDMVRLKPEVLKLINNFEQQDVKSISTQLEVEPKKENTSMVPIIERKNIIRICPMNQSGTSAQLEGEPKRKNTNMIPIIEGKKSIGTCPIDESGIITNNAVQLKEEPKRKNTNMIPIIERTKSIRTCQMDGSGIIINNSAPLEEPKKKNTSMVSIIERTKSIRRCPMDESDIIINNAVQHGVKPKRKNTNIVPIIERTKSIRTRPMDESSIFINNSAQHEVEQERKDFNMVPIIERTKTIRIFPMGESDIIINNSAQLEVELEEKNTNMVPIVERKKSIRTCPMDESSIIINNAAQLEVEPKRKNTNMVPIVKRKESIRTCPIDENDVIINKETSEEDCLLKQIDVESRNNNITLPISESNKEATEVGSNSKIAKLPISGTKVDTNKMTVIEELHIENKMDYPFKQLDMESKIQSINPPAITETNISTNKGTETEMRLTNKTPQKNKDKIVDPKVEPKSKHIFTPPTRTKMTNHGETETFVGTRCDKLHTLEEIQHQKTHTLPEESKEKPRRNIIISLPIGETTISSDKNTECMTEEGPLRNKENYKDIESMPEKFGEENRITINRRTVCTVPEKPQFIETDNIPIQHDSKSRIQKIRSPSIAKTNTSIINNMAESKIEVPLADKNLPRDVLIIKRMIPPPITNTNTSTNKNDETKVLVYTIQPEELDVNPGADNSVLTSIKDTTVDTTNKTNPTVVVLAKSEEPDVPRCNGMYRNQSIISPPLSKTVTLDASSQESHLTAHQDTGSERDNQETGTVIVHTRPEQFFLSRNQHESASVSFDEDIRRQGIFIQPVPQKLTNSAPRCSSAVRNDDMKPKWRDNTYNSHSSASITRSHSVPVAWHSWLHNEQHRRFSTGRRQSVETISNAGSDYSPNVAPEATAFEIKLDSKWYRISKNLYDKIPKGKLRYIRERNAFIRYSDGNQMEQFVENTSEDQGTNEELRERVENLIRHGMYLGPVNSGEVIEMTDDIHFSSEAFVSEPETYSEEVSKVERFIPLDFFGFYVYVTGFQIIHGNAPISFHTFLMMHNTNRTIMLLKKYIYNLLTTGMVAISFTSQDS